MCLQLPVVAQTSYYITLVNSLSLLVHQLSSSKKGTTAFSFSYLCMPGSFRLQAPWGRISFLMCMVSTLKISLLTKEIIIVTAWIKSILAVAPRSSRKECSPLHFKSHHVGNWSYFLLLFIISSLGKQETKNCFLTKCFFFAVPSLLYKSPTKPSTAQADLLVQHWAHEILLLLENSVLLHLFENLWILVNKLLS